jgi:hypothetical protein
VCYFADLIRPLPAIRPSPCSPYPADSSLDVCHPIASGSYFHIQHQVAATSLFSVRLAPPRWDE